MNVVLFLFLFHFLRWRKEAGKGAVLCAVKAPRHAFALANNEIPGYHAF